MMRRLLCTSGCVASSALLAGVADAQTVGAPDKREYTLFNPVPAELLRPLSADRPDTTESPYTVDAGHVQIESSVIDWVREGDDDTLTLASTNLKVGLLHNLDVQFVFDPYVRLNTDDDGLGDTQVRLKMNIWGNDGGRTALAVMPFIKFPTAGDPIGNEKIEGGLIVPFAIDLAEGVGLGLMAEFDAVYDGEADDYDLEFVHTAVVGFDVTDRVGAFVEYVGVASSDSSSSYAASAGLGVTYALNDNCQLDCGVNVGLNDATDDLNPFVGFTIRF
jgi:opacity protein-like surface antigen